MPENQVISPVTGKLDADLLASCIHCGLCLPACPTYQATGRESESPRGRIYLLSLVEKGELPFAGETAEHIESCLGCLGCQTACPSGVRYEEILNGARPYLKRARPKWLTALLRLGFSQVLPNYWFLITGGKVFRLFQSMFPKRKENADRVSVLDSMTGSAFLNRLKAYAAFVPKVPKYYPHPKRREASLSAPADAVHQLFSGCVMDVLYNQVNHATARLLTMQGCPVERSDQTCCGALAYHAGEIDIARKLAKENIEKFEKTEGKIVVTSAGCGAMLKEYPHLFGSETSKDEAENSWHMRAQAFSSRVRDVVEVLSPRKIAAPATQSPALSVAYHAACHLAHAQGIRNEPKEILLALREKLAESGRSLNLVELKDAEHCCGSAGIYNVINTELSMEVLNRKMDNIDDTGAEFVVTTNPGCLLQLNAGAELSNSPVEVMHLAEFVSRAYPEFR